MRNNVPRTAQNMRFPLPWPILLWRIVNEVAIFARPRTTGYDLLHRSSIARATKFSSIDHNMLFDQASSRSAVAIRWFGTSKRTGRIKA